MNDFEQPYRWAYERLQQEFGPSHVAPYSLAQGNEIGVELTSPRHGGTYRLKLRDPDRDYDLNAKLDREDLLDDVIEEVHAWFDEG